MSEPDKTSPHAASSTGCSFQLCIFQDLPQAAGSLVLEERKMLFLPLWRRLQEGAGPSGSHSPGAPHSHGSPPCAAEGGEPG